MCKGPGAGGHKHCLRKKCKKAQVAVLEQGEGEDGPGLAGLWAMWSL